MEKVIFLDFDGVLAISKYLKSQSKKGQPWFDRYGALFDPECVRNLKLITDESTANIVITSSWKMELGLSGIQDMWKERNLPGKVIDVTPDADVLCRGNEIEAWLHDKKEAIRYAIIDDAPITDYFIKEQLPHLFKVDSQVGINEETAQKVIAHLLLPAKEREL